MLKLRLTCHIDEQSCPIFPILISIMKSIFHLREFELNDGRFGVLSEIIMGHISKKIAPYASKSILVIEQEMIDRCSNKASQGSNKIRL